MILKFPTKEGHATFSEIEFYRHRYLSGGMSADTDKDTLDYTFNGKTAVEVCFIGKNQTAETQVISHTPVYVMNDDGRTIDKL